MTRPIDETLLTAKEMIDSITHAEAVRREMPDATAKEQTAEVARRCGSYFMAIVAMNGTGPDGLKF